MEDNTAMQTKLIVNYIPQSMTDFDFRKLFAEIGPLEDCKIMRDRKTNYSFGYAFVEYCQPMHASTAITRLNGFKLKNKMLKVAYSKPAGSSKNVNLYVSGIGKVADETKLLEIFSVYGTVIQAKLLRKQDGTSKETGFVLFKEKPEADNAMKNLQGYSSGYGMSLRIKYAQEHVDHQKQHPKFQEYYQQHVNHMLPSPYAIHQQVASPLPYAGVSYASNLNLTEGVYGGGYGNGFNIGKTSKDRFYARYNPIARPLTAAPLEERLPQFASGDVKLFVYNIGPQAQERDLYALFSQFGTISKINVIPGKGYGFVHMPIPVEAHNAIDALHGVQYMGKSLQVSIKTER